MPADSESKSEPGASQGIQARSGAAGYYVWPLVWIGSVPDNVHISVGPGETPPPLILSQLEETIVSADLPHGIRARADRDGLLVFDFSGWAPYEETGSAQHRFETLANVVLRRVALMNAYHACLLTALVREQNLGLMVSSLSPASIFPLSSFEEPKSIGLPDSRMAHIYSARYPSTYGAYAPMVFDSRISGRQLVEASTVEASFTILRQMLIRDTPERTIALADLLVRSAAAHCDHDYSQALITSWAIIESLLQERWAGYVEQNRERDVDGVKVPFINAARKKRLTQDRDITASLITEFLSIVGHLSIATYHDVSEVRVARNRWIHDLTPATDATSRLAIETATALLLLLGHADLTLPTGLSIQI